MHNKSCSTSHLIDSQSCGRRAGDLNLSSQRTRRCPAPPRPVAAPLLPLLCLNMGLLKRHMEFMRAQGLRRCCCALSGHSQSEWQTENDKEATAANKEKCRQWSRVLLGRRGRGAMWRQGCLESFANLFKSGPLLNCCCCCLCCCHLAACNSFAC